MITVNFVQDHCCSHKNAYIHVPDLSTLRNIKERMFEKYSNVKKSTYVFLKVPIALEQCFFLYSFRKGSGVLSL